MSDKIKPVHLERAAYVYVRQSTMHQVRDNEEGRRRQYALKARATQLGFREVVVIDDDLGVSGAGSQARPGFGRLLSAVCGGTAGAVLAAEASRLARNNRDWHHLIDLCVLTDTLVIDHDGVYDPGQLNDRLLLGLKGTMSEFELALIRQRMQEGLRAKVHRGEVLTEVPIGYVRTENNRVEMTPDRQVQEAIYGVFSKFRQLGSVRQVLLWHRQERIPLPTYHRRQGEVQVVWRLPVYGRILRVLKNPTYAGAFAYGRTRTRTKVVDGRARKTSGHQVPHADWEVLIHDHHPGYISWEEYVGNQELIRGNAAMAGRMVRGPAKSGPALLAGLLRCGRCGRKLHVGYSGCGGRVPRYYCRGASINHGEKPCISFGGLRVDEAIARVVLEALGPIGIGASLDAWQEASRREDEKIRALKLALEKAQYEAERARRQYDVVDPENRLVAAELEARWNEALAAAAEAQSRLEGATAAREQVTEQERERLLELGEDLHSLWNHPGAPANLKKRILRTVLQEIVVDVDEAGSQLHVRLHWAGGVHTKLSVKKNTTGHHRRSTDPVVVEAVGELAKVCDDAAIASILNRLGWRSGKGNTWTQGRVAALRSYRSIPAYDAEGGRPWLTLQQAASALSVSAGVVRRLIGQKVLPARQVVPCAPWVIERQSLDLPGVRSAVRAVHECRRIPRTVRGQTLIPYPETT